MEFTENSSDNKDLILQLIHQDLKHNQLTGGLRKLGFDDFGLHSLNISPIVARLMGMPKEETQDLWDNVYVGFLDVAHQYKVTDLGKELKPLAEKCYEMLVACQENESRMDSNI